MKKIDVMDIKNNIFYEIGSKAPILMAGDSKLGYNAMTVAWGGLGVFWSKKVCFLFVRKSRYTHDFMENSKNASLSFLEPGYEMQKNVFGVKSGRDVDKFKESGLHAKCYSEYDTYYLEESEYVLLLEKIYSIDLPYERLPKELQDRFYGDGDVHTMYICEIKDLLVED